MSIRQPHYNEWCPEDGIRPAINTWYPCKHGDDYWKIIHWSKANETKTALYKVVSLRAADIGFDLTFGMAANLIYTNTRRF